MGTALMTILLTGLLMALVVMMLAALVWSMAKLMHDATGEQRQQRFLQSSVLHVMNRAGR
jgi:uncharacterized membrane protein